MTTLSTRRQLAAPPAAVFAAIKDPARLAKWWGPNGFTNEFEVFEFQPGGKWVFTMVAPDGTRYPNESLFTSIVPDQSVVIKHDCHPFFDLTITLEPANGGTLVRWDQHFDDPAVAEAVRPIAEPANEQNLDRLTTVLG